MLILALFFSKTHFLIAKFFIHLSKFSSDDDVRPVTPLQSVATLPTVPQEIQPKAVTASKTDTIYNDRSSDLVTVLGMESPILDRLRPLLVRRVRDANGCNCSVVLPSSLLRPAPVASMSPCYAIVSRQCTILLRLPSGRHLPRRHWCAVEAFRTDVAGCALVFSLYLMPARFRR